MFAGKKSAQIREILISESAWEEMTCLFAPSLDRTNIAQWAFSIIDADDIRITDQVAWKVIQSLGAVDLPSSDRDYLYGIDDFDDWLRLLES